MKNWFRQKDDRMFQAGRSYPKMPIDYGRVGFAIAILALALILILFTLV